MVTRRVGLREQAWAVEFVGRVCRKKLEEDGAAAAGAAAAVKREVVEGLEAAAATLRGLITEGEQTSLFGGADDER